MSDNMDRLKNLLSIVWQMSSLDPTIIPKWQQDSINKQSGLMSPSDLLLAYRNLSNQGGYTPPTKGSAIIPDSLRNILKQAAGAAGVPASWADSPALANILEHESSFNPNAKNPHSTAYGLFQFLDSTWRGTGVQKTSDPLWQSIAGLRYIANRYGNPENAWNFWQSHRWY